MQWFKRGSWQRIENLTWVEPVTHAGNVENLDIRTRVVRFGVLHRGDKVRQEYLVRNYFPERMRVLTSNVIPNDSESKYADGYKVWITPPFELDRSKSDYARREAQHAIEESTRSPLTSIKVEVMAYFRVPHGDLCHGLHELTC